ncbi:MAG: fructoselysine 6-kinase [Oscillospiraceae bacterium]|nr:fructoselysine 6-kinase [Oscillospiraceae bacterium]
MIPHIACIGDSCVDHYEALGQKFPGGNPVNFAVYLRRVGAEASFIGAVGSDEDGLLVRDALAGKGVDVSHVQVLEGPTPTTTVTMEQGNRVFTSYEPGVMEDYRLRPRDLDFIARHDLAVTALWGRCEGDLAAIRARGVPVAFDCADLPEDPAALAALPNVDIAFFSDDGSSLEALMDKARGVAAMGPGTVVVMRGARGSMVYDGRTFYLQGAVDCPVVDTLGAGDSYIAGFLHAALLGKPIPERMRAGSENAAVTIGYVGAW